MANPLINSGDAVLVVYFVFKRSVCYLAFITNLNSRSA